MHLHAQACSSCHSVFASDNTLHSISIIQQHRRSTLTVRSSEALAKVFVSLGLNTHCMT